MILLDSSVLIDHFRGTINSQTQQFTRWLSGDDGYPDMGVADLVVFEVVRGFPTAKAQAKARDLLLAMEVVEIGGLENALFAASLYQRLRQSGRTVRSPIDVLLASYCITHGHTLLHRDADFESLKTLVGLDTWPH
ncbi:PIN domain-containing protein [Limnohabitans sp. 15K]|uniref:type II toxin-antitoxin system VapC family toxin n=1 Tax=Limnohabitans sp. 15K TaxID=1100706 RepID=UPI000C1F7CE1|nr:PIN domain-containing protein [Limnohabitans sp. 15K]PIT81319.1 VapC toxin family PIN domain ribonuclease [Limnohabitans sp. 15K]